MKMLMAYDGTYLIPASQDSQENYEKLKGGQEYNVELKQARNPNFHRLAFALIKAMFENQEAVDDFDTFRLILKKLAGSYSEYIHADGTVWYMPDSWSFADMDEIQFHKIHNKLLTIAAKRYGDHFVEQFA